MGAFTLTTQPLAESGLALPFSVSAAFATSFSNLNLPAGVFWEIVSDPLAPPDYGNWLAEVPAGLELAQAWAISFREVNLPADMYWDLLSDPLTAPDPGTGSLQCRRRSRGRAEGRAISKRSHAS